MNQTEDKLQRILLKLGSDPKRSSKWFFLGLLLFLAALILIYLGAATYPLLQLVGLLLMVLACASALRGYIGILANRLAYFRHNAAKNRQKYKHLK